MPIKFLILGGVFRVFFFGGGGSADFIFMGAGIFLNVCSELQNQIVIAMKIRTFRLLAEIYYQRQKIYPTLGHSRLTIIGSSQS